MICSIGIGLSLFWVTRCVLRRRVLDDIISLCLCFMFPICYTIVRRQDFVCKQSLTLASIYSLPAYAKPGFLVISDS